MLRLETCADTCWVDGLQPSRGRCPVKILYLKSIITIKNLFAFAK